MICRRLGDLAERLYGTTIGTKPITKADAADQIEDLRIRLARVADPE